MAFYIKFLNFHLIHKLDKSRGNNLLSDDLQFSRELVDYNAFIPAHTQIIQ